MKITRNIQVPVVDDRGITHMISKTCVFELTEAEKTAVFDEVEHEHDLQAAIDHIQFDKWDSDDFYANFGCRVTQSDLTDPGSKYYIAEEVVTLFNERYDPDKSSYEQWNEAVNDAVEMLGIRVKCSAEAIDKARDEIPKSFLVVDAVYVSEWDDELEIRTPCKVHLATHEITKISVVHVDGVECCTAEFVEIEGRHFPVIDYDEYLQTQTNQAYWHY